MTHDEAHDPRDTGPDADAEGLWDPEVANDDVRSLEKRLRSHRHRPQVWVVPGGAPGDPEASPDTQGAGRLNTPVAHDDGMFEAGRDGEHDTDATAGAAGPWRDPAPYPAQHRAVSQQESATQSERIPVWQAAGGWRVRTLWVMAGAALALFFLGDSLGWFGTGQGQAHEVQVPYLVEASQGLTTIERRNETYTGERLEVLPGDRLVCDAVTRATLHVARAGNVRMEPGTELRIDSAPGDGWRLYLERGQVTASIFAAPRLFQVGTPSGIAVDLGCVYTATVGEDGETILSVRGGQVSFEIGDRKVFVPEGARVVARPGRGPGTPVWADASAPLKKAVEQLDALADTPAANLDRSGGRSALDELSRITDRRESLSLWHLVDHPHPQVARAALERLTWLSAPPEGVDLADIRAGEATALTAWRKDLQTSW